MRLSDIFKIWLKKGFRITWSDGPPFDPTWQERTDPIDDIIKNEEKRDGKNKERA